MWRKEDPKTRAVPEISTGAGQSASTSAALRETPASAPVSARAVACISQGIKIRGDITGNEDLFVDGDVDGRLDLGASSVTIGPNGRVKADVSARDIIVRGRVDGKVAAREKVQLWSTGHVIGEISAERLVIEDGAVLRGRAEIAKRSERQTDAFRAAPKPPEQKKVEPLPVPTGPAAD